MKKLIVIALAFSMLIPTINTKAATTYFKDSQKTVSVVEFDRALKKATGSPKGFISKSFNIKDTSKSITRLEAAKLVYNAHRYKEGKDNSLNSGSVKLYNEYMIEVWGQDGVVIDSNGNEVSNTIAMHWTFRRDLKDGTASVSFPGWKLVDRKNSDITKALYAEVVSNKILKDITKAPSADRKYARYAYVWGIIEGTSAGDYSKQRNFNWSANLTGTDANLICQRLENSKLRFSITYDGQLIRTTNLPKNYKDFKYILANVPNQFYDVPYLTQTWNKGTLVKPVDLRDSTVRYKREGATFKDVPFINNSSVREDIVKNWTDKVYKNFNLRTKVDYKTIGAQWVRDVSNSYWIVNDERELKKIKKLEEYVKFAKDNKITITNSQVFTDPSVVYVGNGQPTVRVHVRLKISIGNKNYKVQGVNDLKGSGAYLDGVDLIPSLSQDDFFVNSFKQNKWYDFIVDVPMASYIINGDAYGFSISYDSMDNWNIVNLEQLLNRFK